MYFTNLWPVDPAELCEHLQDEEAVEIAQRERMQQWHAELALLKGDRLYKATNRATLAYKQSIRRAGSAFLVRMSKAHKAAILRKYEKAAEREFWSAEPHEVHHIVPLHGLCPETGEHIVCGLHVPWNLVVTTREENRRLGATVPAECLNEIDYDPFGSSSDNGDANAPF